VPLIETLEENDGTEPEVAEPSVIDPGGCEAVEVIGDPAAGMPTSDPEAPDDDNLEEGWEAELEDQVRDKEVQAWPELRERIKRMLDHDERSLSLSQVNQLLLLRNFATLRVKGLGAMAASRELA
jgi:hypothetical protein